MNIQNLTLLKLLEGEFAQTLLPNAGSDMARQIATVSGRLLSRRLVEETILPGLQAEAIDTLGTLLPALRGQVAAEFVDAIEQALDAVQPSWAQIEILLQQAVASLLAQRNTASNKLAARLIAIDARLRDQHETAYLERSQTTPAKSVGWDLSKFSEEQQAALLDFIKQKFPEETGLTIANTKPLVGGFGKQTVFITLANNSALPRTIVLRRDPPYETASASVTTEYPVIERMYTAGVPVAQPYALEDTGKILGTKFMLTAAVEGRNIGDALIVEHNPAVAIDLACVLARLHAVPITGLEKLLSGGALSVLERIRGEIEQWDACWKGLDHYQSYTVQAALDWLKINIDLAAAPPVLVHGDIGMHNVLVHDDRIAAVLDWETPAVGARAEDLGWLYYTVCQLGDWSSFIEIYEKEAGVSLDRRQLDYYVLWKLISMTVILARVGNAVLSGQRDNIQLMYIGDHIKETLINRMATKLAEVLTRD